MATSFRQIGKTREQQLTARAKQVQQLAILFAKQFSSCTDFYLLLWPDGSGCVQEEVFFGEKESKIVFQWDVPEEGIAYLKSIVEPGE